MFPSQKITMRNLTEENVALGVESKGCNQEPILSCLDCKNTINDMSYFSSSSTMKKLQVDLNNSKKVLKFTEKITEVLKSIKKLNSEDEIHIVFLFVLQSCEDYLYEHTTEEKISICVSLLKSFVNGDVKICNAFFKIVDSKLKKTSWLRRNKKKIAKFFFLVVKQLF